MHRLFNPNGPRVWNLPSGRPFLAHLARALLNAVGNTEELADALIYVPNRRSARTLASELHVALGRSGVVILPDIRALGDLESDEAPPGTDAAFRDVGPSLSEARRLGALTMLVQRWYDSRGTPMPPSACLAAARDLARLLDEAAMAGGVDWSRLPSLAGTADMATHWQQSVDFLTIVTEHWPTWLAENGAIDALERRIDAAEAIADSWRETPPAGPVLIAGSTGATPASRLLMRATMDVPQGAIVLPGLDGNLSQGDMDLIKRDAPSHPQYHLLHTLAHLGESPPDIAVLTGEDELGNAAQRRRLIHESLAPAELTGDWTERLNALSGPHGRADFGRQALEGLSLVPARDEAHEATMAACLLRVTLETPGETAALVTPDRALARRVSALLQRWGIQCAPSEGRPLLTTKAGRRLDALLSFWVDPPDALGLAALLDLSGVQAPGRTDLFERHVLRGVTWWRSIDHLVTDVERRLGKLHRSNRPDPEHIPGIVETAHWVRDLSATRPNAERFDFEHFKAHLSPLIAMAFGPEEMWRGPDGAALAGLIEQLGDLTASLGPLSHEAWLDLYRALATGSFVSADMPSHGRLTIWGPLEARLQHADRFILAGLNEDVWPARIRGDGFLPPRFRGELGLPDPEERMGLAAHDFAGLACASDVTILYSERREDAPAIASRWVWRLQTLAKGALGDDADAALGPQAGRDPRQWADAVHEALPTIDKQTIIPRPKPPVEARPRRLSATRIETLIRDPYAIYGESILKLPKLDPVGAPIDARQTGTAIHKALERYDETGAGGGAALLDLLLEELTEAGEQPAALLSRRAVLAQTAHWYADWFDKRRSGVEHAFLEVSGETAINSPGGPFTLSSQADRIEVTGGLISILDFKTGSPPSQAQVDAGLSPQMPLQALIAAAGGYQGIPVGEIAELSYIAFKAKPDERVLKRPQELMEAAKEGISTLIAAYDSEDQPYFSAPRPQFIKYVGDYTRLARRDEWTGEDGDD